MRPATSGTFAKLLRAACPEVADRCDPYALALNFVLSAPQVSVAIVGTRTVEEVEANNRLSDDTSRRLDLTGCTSGMFSRGSHLSPGDFSRGACGANEIRTCCYATQCALSPGPSGNG